jgi:N-acetylmuramoyl-L-alanine amidase
MTKYLVVFLIVFTLCVTQAQALTVTAMRAGTHPDKMRLVIELDAIADFRVTTVDNPKRLVVDLPADHVDDRSSLELGRIGITDVRQETASGQTRLSFLLARPVKVLSAFMLPQGNGKPDRLVIDYRPSTHAEFIKAIPQILGTLTDRTPVASSGVLGVLSRGNVIPVVKPSRTAEPKDQAQPNTPVRQYTIVIDPGHGGKDPGAVAANKIYEKNITLAASHELKRQLESSGRYRILMTRSTDRFILLHDRVKFARQQKADLFISLHADMASEDARGLSVYTLSDTASDAQTEKLAARENKVDLLAGIDLSHQSKDVANILIDLAMRENMNQSRFFAGKVVGAMSSRNLDLLESPHRYAGFAVLKAADIPSILVEMGFLSNTTERRRLQDEAHRRKLMQGLVAGIDTYFAYLEKNRLD